MRYIYFYESGESGQSKRGKVNGPSKVDGPSESERSRVKVGGLLTKSGRSFDGNWTVLQKVDGPSESGRSF